ncbi:MAG: tyrosine-type recombinase/integrase [Alphaproteobacteria bacterium]|nr:tyrosine-type recombinase/integrase [Alphaproteobacteria bacterium]
MTSLTKRVVESSKPLTKQQYYVWDDKIRGFGLRITPNGVKSYILQYRTAQGRLRRYTIGKHGSPWTCEDARDKAGDLLVKIKDGYDPLDEKAETRAALTVKDLAAIYIAEGPEDKPNKKPSSWKADESNINRHIIPQIGRRYIRTITQADVARFQRDVAEGKTACDEKTGPRGRAIVKGGKGTAARSLAVLGAMLQFAVGRNLIASNPAKGVKLFKGNKKEKFLSEKEISILFDGLKIMEDTFTISKQLANVIRLLLLTGARKAEILSLQWKFVDFEKKCLRLPDSKTGAKIIRLSAPALALLSKMRTAKRTNRAGDDLDWVFPASRGTHHAQGLQKAFEGLREWCGMTDLRIHDLRHTYASLAIASGASLYLTGKALGHKQSRTTEIYAHLHDDPVQSIIEKIGGRIADKDETMRVVGATPEKSA